MVEANSANAQSSPNHMQSLQYTLIRSCNKATTFVEINDIFLAIKQPNLLILKCVRLEIK